MFSWLLPHRLVPNLLKGPRTIGSIVVYIFSVGLILFGLSKVDSKAKPITGMCFKNSSQLHNLFTHQLLRQLLTDQMFLKIKSFYR